MKWPGHILVIAILIGGCATEPRWVKTELYFGLSQKDGAQVSEAQWKEFVQKELTPRFPEGMTAVAGEGQWLSGGKVIHEHTRVIILVHPDSNEASQKIDDVRQAYREQFGQESVLRVDEKVGVKF